MDDITGKVAETVARLRKWGEGSSLAKHFLGTKSAREDCAEAADLLKALAARLVAVEAERRMIVSHATMGGTDGEGLGLNDVCVEITALRNALYLDGKNRAEAAESALARMREEQDAMVRPDIEAIERGRKRWHGEDHRVVNVRWEPYKPDGQRQMKALGRWQEQQGGGDYWRWVNCERPSALKSPTPAQPQKGDSDE